VSYDLPVKIGVHSLTVVCNKVGETEDALRFDGICNKEPENEVQYFKIAPRQAVPLKPNPVILDY
jgi:hypothetical protein